MFQILLTTLLLEGFITISVEVLAIRQLTPFYGSSIVITSLIIGIFLLFLALGYWRGGTYRRDFCKHLSQNFMFSMIWVGIGLSYLFISLYCFTVTASPLLSLLGYLIFILAPIVYWLGQTIPLTTNLFSETHGVSRISSYALFTSTVGSFLGAIITSLILFQYLGVAWAVVINCLLLFMLILQLKPHSQISWFSLLISACFICIIYLANLHNEKDMFQLTNNYGNYRIHERSNASRTLEINLSNSSLLTKNQEGHQYIQFLRHLLFDELKLKHKEILVIGSGGFTFSAKGTHENQITYIDIDPTIKELAETHFLKAPIEGHFIGKDARLYLRNHKKQYDVIISDVYSHGNSVPPSLLTTEYFQQLASHLTKNGLLIANIISNPMFQNQYSQRVSNTIHGVFGFCAVIPLQWVKTSNVLYVCPSLQAEHKKYSDNLSTATLDFFKGY